jgi:HEAT repeat protein
MEQSFQDKLNEIVQKCDPGDRASVQGAVQSLLDAGGTSFQDTLALSVDRRAEANVRATACWVLCSLKDPAAIPALVRALDDDDRHVRTEAVRALGLLGDASVVEALLRVFRHDSDSWVRDMAITGLSLLGGPVVIEPLVTSLLDRDEPTHVRSSCADALGDIAQGWELDEQPRKTAMEALLSVLQDEQTEVRLFAAFALGKFRDPAAIPALQRVVEADEGIDPRWGPVRDEAKEAIAVIDGR